MSRHVATPNPPRVSVIIVTSNGSEVLGRCLDSVATQRVAGGFETIVVDNASTDATPELLAARAGQVRIVRNDHNAGYAAGNNRGASEARGRVLLFLNDDTELLASDVIERLARVAEEPGMGIVGPKLVNPDGSMQPSCAAHPTVTRALLMATGIHRLAPARFLHRVDPERWAHDRALDVGWVKGAALAIRADLFDDLRGFWSTIYAEEEDLAYRAQRLGARVRFEPSATIMHIGNFTIARTWTTTERAARVARAELVFLRAHYGRLRAASIRAISGAGYAARAVLHAALGRTERASIFRAMTRVYAWGGPDRADAATGGGHGPPETSSTLQ